MCEMLAIMAIFVIPSGCSFLMLYYPLGRGSQLEKLRSFSILKASPTVLPFDMSVLLIHPSLSTVSELNAKPALE